MKCCEYGPRLGSNIRHEKLRLSINYGTKLIMPVKRFIVQALGLALILSQ